MALSIQDGSDTCADCTAFFTDRKEMAIERIDNEEAEMNKRCSSLEPSKVEECKRKVEEVCQRKKDKANSQVEGKRRCKDCKNFLNDVKEKEMASVTSVGELIETRFCGKLSEDRQEKCESFIETATEKEIELLDLVNVENTCKLLDMCGGN
ncbi:uncharacterized protein [Haliotis asinina]|uniref:uncharacterized protein n=1 Tax=Haliotis asinina TaxID=109174 RepID=UPI003531A078